MLHRRISGFALEGANNLGGRSGEFKILVFSLTCSNLYFNHSYCNLIQRTFINIFLGGGGGDSSRWGVKTLQGLKNVLGVCIPRKICVL